MGLGKRVRRANKVIARKRANTAYSKMVQPEDFVVPLVNRISVELQCPQIDLSTPEKARESLERINETSLLIEQFEDKIQKLGNMLEQRRFSLEIEELDDTKGE